MNENRSYTPCHFREYIAARALRAAGLELPANHFYTYLIAAIMEADTDNLEMLREIFPEVVAEIQDRYNAPGGALTDSEYKFVTEYYARRDVVTAEEE